MFNVQKFRVQSSKAGKVQLSTNQTINHSTFNYLTFLTLDPVQD